MFALGLALATFIGLTLGLLGGGGSILTVPVLVYVLGYAAKPAIAMSMPVVGVTSLLAAALHWRLGNVRIRTALAFGVLAMGGAFAGARVGGFLSDTVQLTLLAVVMLAAAVSMLRKRAVDDTVTAATPRLALLAPVAFGVGMLTGLVGIGGGFLVVPALVLLARIPMRQAVGTSLLIIAMNSVAGFVGYIGTVDVDWPFLAGFTAASAAGAVVGTALVARVPQAALTRGFAVLLLVMSGFVLYQNRSAFSFSASTARSSTAPRDHAVAREPFTTRSPEPRHACSFNASTTAISLRRVISSAASARAKP